jgi:hypothetical protein
MYYRKFFIWNCINNDPAINGGKNGWQNVLNVELKFTTLRSNGRWPDAQISKARECNLKSVSSTVQKGTLPSESS